ncbi:MAG: hypothetical protein LCI02_05040 [Proteobacteria bacterium]|nr:hypothetical protein [Pseudomonadota bacterium]
MTPKQQSALEALAGRTLSVVEVEQIDAALAAGDLAAVATLLSVDRKRLAPRILSARGLAEQVPGGPIAAEIILMKLEGARDKMLESSDPQQRVMGSLLRRQLGFLAGDGLDFGSPQLRGMLDQFAALGILDQSEVDGLQRIALVDDPITWRQVADAVQGVE